MNRRRSLLKIAALRSKRERQEGVKMGYNQYVDKSASTMFKSPSMPIGTNDFTLEYFGNLYGAISSNTPLIFNANAPYAYLKGCLLVYGTPQIAVRWIIFEKPSSGDMLLDSINLIEGVQESILHIALTRKGTTVKIYINGELKATKEQSAVKDLGDFRLGMANSSNMVMSRIYNYALSAEEVAALYNDGDPSEYVLPGTMKGLTPVEIIGENSHTWTGADDPVSFNIKINRVLSVGGVFRITGSVSNYKSGTPYLNLGNSSIAYLPKDNSPFTLVVTLKKGSSTLLPYIYIYGGSSSEDKQLTITVDSIELVGCIAEYLPQNLVGSPHDDPIEIVGENSYTWTGVDSPYSHSVALSRKLSTDSIYRVKITISDYESGIPDFKISANNTTKIPAANGTYAFDVQVKGTPYPYVLVYAGPTGTNRRVTITVDSIEPVSDVALSWLDSSKNLPLNDEYLPPLLQSDGGYDLTASGTPEIIIK